MYFLLLATAVFISFAVGCLPYHPRKTTILGVFSVAGALVIAGDYLGWKSDEAAIAVIVITAGAFFYGMYRFGGPGYTRRWDRIDAKKMEKMSPEQRAFREAYLAELMGKKQEK